jgi:hypothetical protein
LSLNWQQGLGENRMQATKMFRKPVPPNAVSYQIEVREGPWHHVETVMVTADPTEQLALDDAVRAILRAQGKPEQFKWT